jgi:hypothetical protein
MLFGNLDVPVDVLQVLAGTSNGNFASSIPPEWARNGLWRLAARELLKQAPGLNDSQRA